MEAIEGRDPLATSVADVWDHKATESFKQKLSKIRNYDQQFWPCFSLDSNMQNPELPSNAGPSSHNVLRDAQPVKFSKDSNAKAKPLAGGKGLGLPRKENIQKISSGVKTTKVDSKAPLNSSLPISKLGNMVSTINILCTVRATILTVYTYSHPCSMTNHFPMPPLGQIHPVRGGKDFVGAIKASSVQVTCNHDYENKN